MRVNEPYKGLKRLVSGVLDKDGNKIAEGDIIGVPNPKVIYVVRFGKYDNGEDYEDHKSGVGFYLEEVKNFGRLHSMFLETRIHFVMGNIYQKNSKRMIDERYNQK